MTPNIELFVKYGSIACGILFFLTLFIVKWIKGNTNNLGDLIVVGLGGTSVPTGLALVYCSFDPTQITKLSDSGIYIAIAGLSLLYIAGTTFKEKL